MKLYYLVHAFRPIAQGSKENCEELMKNYPDEKNRMMVVSVDEYNKLVK